jgi:hypothetical protein
LQFRIKATNFDFRSTQNNEICVIDHSMTFHVYTQCSFN